jgi:hypothetical protein
MVPVMKVWLTGMEFLFPATVVANNLQSVYNVISKGFHLMLVLLYVYVHYLLTN